MLDDEDAFKQLRTVGECFHCFGVLHTLRMALLA